MSDYIEYVAAKLTHLSPLSHTAEMYIVHLITFQDGRSSLMYTSGTGHTEVADELEELRAEVGIKMLTYFVTISYLQALPPPVHVIV